MNCFFFDMKWFNWEGLIGIVLSVIFGKCSLYKLKLNYQFNMENKNEFQEMEVFKE